MPDGQDFPSPAVPASRPLCALVGAIWRLARRDPIVTMTPSRKEGTAHHGLRATTENIRSSCRRDGPPIAACWPPPSQPRTQVPLTPACCIPAWARRTEPDCRKKSTRLRSAASADELAKYFSALPCERNPATGSPPQLDRRRLTTNPRPRHSGHCRAQPLIRHAAPSAARGGDPDDRGPHFASSKR